MPLELAEPEPEPEPETPPAQEPESEPVTELGPGQRRQVRGRWSRRTEPWASDFCTDTFRPQRIREVDKCAHGVFDVTLPVSCERRNQG